MRKGETAIADLSEIAESLVERDIAKTEELTKAAISANIPAQEILNKDVVAAMEVVGERFEDYYRVPRWSLTTRCHGYIIGDKNNEGPGYLIAS